jgi:hypothetical protein
MGTEGEMLQAPTATANHGTRGAALREPQGAEHSSWRAYRSGLGEPGWNRLPLSLHPTSEKGGLVLWVTCIGEFGGAYTLRGPRWADLSGTRRRDLPSMISARKATPASCAVDWFDPERGLRLSTYATWWICQGVQRGLRNRGRAMILLPVHTGETGSPRPTLPTRRSPPNSNATPAPAPRSLQYASARGGSRRCPLGAGESHWTVEARGNRRRGLRRAGRHDRGRVPASRPRGARRGGHRSREHLGGPRRRPPRPHAAGTHGYRPLPRDRRPPSQKLADVAEELGLSHVRVRHVRQLQCRAEDELRAETPANLALAAGG